jgi:hypothetical protein
MKIKRPTDENISWICQYCSKDNEVWLDLTTANKFDFIEDCMVCCRPNRIIVTIDEDDNILVESRFIDE